MEQKKLLWVILSVAVFLLVVVTVGVLWFLPSAEAPTEGKPGLAGMKSGEEFDPIEWVREEEEYPGLEEREKEKEESEDFIVVYGESEEEKEEAEKDVEEKAPLRQPKEKKEEKERKEVSRAPEKAQPTPKTTPKEVKVAEYWIQTGSFTSKTRAQQTKNQLVQKGVACLITTKTIDDTTYYRVRIGPYSSKQEAEKFLTWIQSVRGFSGSYISLVYTTKQLVN